MNIQEYIKELDLQFQTGKAREHSYRPALQQLLATMLPNCVVTNEPAHFECGAPDYIISQKTGAKQPIFFVEAKDVNDGDLDGNGKHKEQFHRYRSSLDYIVFTDYLDFHFYENGEWVKNIRIAQINGNHICKVSGAEAEFTAMIEHLALSKPAKITSATKLAQLMAGKARLLADVIVEAFSNAETNSEHYYENSQLQSELDAFRKVLIHDLEPKAFADIYAQTVAYGMFAARLHDETPDDFSRQEASSLIPKTNPFLRQIFQHIAGYDVDERISWIIDDLVQTFLATDVKKVMKRYGKNNLHNDPLIHFYEDFLCAYDAKLRKSKGVWYTPQPVVSFIVRAVDDILKKDFNLEEGLADSSKIEHKVKNKFWNGKKPEEKYNLIGTEHRVQILDPATGTGTFLAEVINQIYKKFEGLQGMWQSYVEEHLLPRVHGFEILMASYAVAHLKLDLLLSETGYDFAKTKNKRLKVYLTNSLEEYMDDSDSLFGMAQYLSSEANEASHIKKDCPVMVMVGNPPYSISSSNKGEWISSLVDDYKQNLNERNIQPLSDDYIKFIRLGQSYVERNGQGILAYISNNSFIDGIIHREMRHQLLLAFDDIYIVNLHGNARKKEIAPDGSKDENVFDIMQGVSINVFVRKPNHKQGKLGKVFYKDIFGSREDKYDYLDEHSLFNNVDWNELPIVEPNYFFVPKDFSQQEEYEKGVSVNKLFLQNTSGVKTHHDAELVSFDSFNTSTNTKYDYRPLESRWINYDLAKVVRHRYDKIRHMLNPNTGLALCRISATDLEWCLVSITEHIADICYVSGRTKEGSYVFPLYLYTTAIDGTEEKIPNLNKDEWKRFKDAVGRDVTPEELLQYIYGVLHSPTYRERYKEFLKIDFPRIPLPMATGSESANEYFERIANYGKQLIDLHLMHDAGSWKLKSQFNIAGSNKVEELRYDAGNVWINATQYFGNVSATAWNAYIGGYQPAQKWLKDRKGRTLNFDDIRHYLRIVHALNETQRIMEEIG